MQRTAVKLLEKLIELENAFVALYKEMSEKNASNYATKNTANILAREEERHALLYQSLIEDVKKYDLVPINETIQDQVEYNMIMLKKTMNTAVFDSVKDLITLAIDFENQNLYILSDIIKQLKNNEPKVDDKIIEIFKNLFAEEKKHIKNLELFL